jgi:DNA-binding response OmpR family regulator
MKILVVDDQQDIRELAASLLVGDGYEVGTAENGLAALERLETESFDLVLLDINMPHMDGWETLRLIRADAEWRHLPVVMFSIKSETVDKVQGMQEGALDYITKPFEVDEFLRRVRRVLETAAEQRVV